MLWPFPGYEDATWTVIGVAADTRYRELLAPRPAVYLPLDQFHAFSVPYFALRTTTAQTPAALLSSIQRMFDEVHPSLRVLDASSIATLMQSPTARRRFAALVLALFAIIAVFLATIGIHGVLAHFVSAHTRELGVRRSLGARPLDVWMLVMGRGLRPAVVGVAAGLVLAVLGARAIRSALFGVSPADPPTLVFAAAAVISVAALACVLPASRASRVPPGRSAPHRLRTSRRPDHSRRVGAPGGAGTVLPVARLAERAWPCSWTPVA